MDDRRAGRFVAAIRIHLALRQDDLAEAAGVSQNVITLIETGRLERVSLRNFRRVCGALAVDAGFDLRWRGGLGDRLIDTGHAAIVEHVIAWLRDAGWEPLPEFSFNVYGDRGSVDILAWHTPTRTLLIVEVKTRLADLQAMLMSLSRKVRVVPGDAAKRLGWARSGLGTLVVAAATHGNRSVVAAHQATFDAVLPARAAEIKRWLRSPTGDIAGVWFVPLPPGSRGAKAVAGRVRRPRA